MVDYTALPADLPRPVDDGACAHLPGLTIPHLVLPSTQGGTVDVGALPGRTVLYVYPMTGVPGRPLPDGWDAIPGARGCTPQACTFRDNAQAFAALGANLLGLSTQTIEEQREFATRMHLPYALLSDAELTLTQALRLPTFVADGLARIRRLTLVLERNRIEHVFYPVFPPDRSVEPVLDWLRDHPRA
jgi:peroxiredoxin